MRCTDKPRVVKIEAMPDYENGTGEWRDGGWREITLADGTKYMMSPHGTVRGLLKWILHRRRWLQRYSAGSIYQKNRRAERALKQVISEPVE